MGLCVGNYEVGESPRGVEEVSVRILEGSRKCLARWMAMRQVLGLLFDCLVRSHCLNCRYPDILRRPVDLANLSRKGIFGLRERDKLISIGVVVVVVSVSAQTHCAALPRRSLRAQLPRGYLNEAAAPNELQRVVSVGDAYADRMRDPHCLKMSPTRVIRVHWCCCDGVATGCWGCDCAGVCWREPHDPPECAGG